MNKKITIGSRGSKLALIYAQKAKDKIIQNTNIKDEDIIIKEITTKGDQVQDVKLNYPDFIYISSLSVFLGHVFPIWLKFKGGKGVATYVGILFSINLIFGIIFGITWILIFLISKYSSLSSLIGSISIPIYLFIFNEEQIIFFVIMFVLVFYTHRENIKRLKNKEESKSKIY